MDDNWDEEKIMTFMAMTECHDRNTAIRLLDDNNWDEVIAANTFFAEKHTEPPQVRAPIPSRSERLIDDYAYQDRNFYGQDPFEGPKFEMPNILGGIGSFFSNLKDQVFGCSGGKYFLKELKDKHPDTNFNGIDFE